MKEIIHAFNHANDKDVDELTDADLPCAGANPTVDEINTGFQNLTLRINKIAVLVKWPISACDSSSPFRNSH